MADIVVGTGVLAMGLACGGRRSRADPQWGVGVGVLPVVGMPADYRGAGGDVVTEPGPCLALVQLLRLEIRWGRGAERPRTQASFCLTSPRDVGPLSK